MPEMTRIHVGDDTNSKIFVIPFITNTTHARTHTKKGGKPTMI